MQKVKLSDLVKQDDPFKIQSVEQYQSLSGGGGRKEPSLDEIEAFKTALSEDPDPVQPEGEVEAGKLDVAGKAEKGKAVEQKETDKQQAEDQEDKKKLNWKKEDITSRQVDAESNRLEAAEESQKNLGVTVILPNAGAERPAQVRAPVNTAVTLDAVRTPPKPALLPAEEPLPLEPRNIPHSEHSKAPSEFHDRMQPEIEAEALDTSRTSALPLPQEKPLLEKPLLEKPLLERAVGGDEPPILERAASYEPSPQPAPNGSLDSFPALRSLLKAPTKPALHPEPAGHPGPSAIVEPLETSRAPKEALVDDEDPALREDAGPISLPVLGLVLEAGQPANLASDPTPIGSILGRTGQDVSQPDQKGQPPLVPKALRAEGQAPAMPISTLFQDPVPPSPVILARNPTPLRDENPLLAEPRVAVPRETVLPLARNPGPYDRTPPSEALPKPENRALPKDQQVPQVHTTPEDSLDPKNRPVPGDRVLPEPRIIPEPRTAPKDPLAPKDQPAFEARTTSYRRPTPEAEARLPSEPAVVAERPERLIAPDVWLEPQEPRNLEESEEGRQAEEQPRAETRSESATGGIGNGRPLPKSEWDGDDSRGSDKDKDEDRFAIRRREEKLDTEDEATVQWAPPVIFRDAGQMMPIQPQFLHHPNPTPFTREVMEMVSRLLVTADPFSATQQVRMTLRDDLLPGAEIRFSTEGGVLKMELHGADASTADILEREAGSLKSALEAATGGEVEVKVFGADGYRENRGST